MTLLMEFYDATSAQRAVRASSEQVYKRVKAIELKSSFPILQIFIF